MRIERLCVFAGSREGADPGYRRAAEALGRELAERRIGLVYGGAGIGLMGAVADAVLAAGGEVVGVIPEALVSEEVAHRGLSEQRVVGSMHERKAAMAELADAFVALPGGLGTFEELLEAATWSQLGIHAKPCGLLNVSGYYDRLVELLDHAVGEAFLSAKHRSIVVVEDDPPALLGRLGGWEPPAPKRAFARRAK